MSKKIYLAGKITGDPDYYQKFLSWKDKLEAQYPYDKKPIILRPTFLPGGLEHEEYLMITLAMVDTCDAIALIPDWADSAGAKIELAFALTKGKEIIALKED